MDTRKIHVNPKNFRSILIPIAAVLYLIAAAGALPDVLLRFSASYRALLLADLAVSGVVIPSAVDTWMIIYTAVAVANFAAAVFLTLSLFVSLRGRPGRGLGLLSNAAQVGVYILNGIGVILIAVLVWRLGVYFYTNIQIDEGIYLIYGMLLSEALMVLLACVIFFNLRRFLVCVSGSAVSIGYTLTCGKLDTVSIPGFTATGFLLLGFTGLILAFDMICTVASMKGPSGQYYQVLVSQEPARWAAGISMLCGGIASMLLFIYLRKYKRVCEQTIFNSRLRMGTKA